jgi:N-carbamoylputrescine amidase
MNGHTSDQPVKITVCEFPDEHELKETAWAALVDYLAAVGPGIVLLPDIPFCDWIFVGDAVDNALWRKAVEQHDVMIARLSELASRWIMSSRPVEQNGQRFNEAFIWSQNDGYRAIRRKWYLPDVRTARETLWFNQGDCNFVPVRADAICVGLQLCSEMMFTWHAQDMGFDGGHLVVQPRASGRAARWRIASEMCAIAAGAYVASANRRSFSHDLFSGGSWLLSPDADSLCETTKERPFATAEVDLATANRAKQQYPRDLYRRYRA